MVDQGLYVSRLAVSGGATCYSSRMRGTVPAPREAPT